MLEVADVNNFSSLFIRLSYDVYLEDELNEEIEEERIRRVLYKYISELQKAVGDEIPIQLNYGSRIYFIKDDEPGWWENLQKD